MMLLICLSRGPPGKIVQQIFYNTVVAVLMTPFTMGLQMMCVRRALGAPGRFPYGVQLLSQGRHLGRRWRAERAGPQLNLGY